MLSASAQAVTASGTQVQLSVGDFVAAHGGSRAADWRRELHACGGADGTATAPLGYVLRAMVPAARLGPGGDMCALGLTEEFELGLPGWAEL